MGPGVPVEGTVRRKLRAENSFMDKERAKAETLASKGQTGLSVLGRKLKGCRLGKGCPLMRYALSEPVPGSEAKNRLRVGHRKAFLLRPGVG